MTPPDSDQRSSQQRDQSAKFNGDRGEVGASPVVRLLSPAAWLIFGLPHDRNHASENFHLVGHSLQISGDLLRV